MTKKNKRNVDDESTEEKWLRINRPDKWRKLQRLKLEREHNKKHKKVNTNDR